MGFRLFKADPAALAALDRLTKATRENAVARLQMTLATYALVRALRSFSDRNASAVVLGPLELVDKPPQR